MAGRERRAPSRSTDSLEKRLVYYWRPRKRMPDFPGPAAEGELWRSCLTYGNL